MLNSKSGSPTFQTMINGTNTLKTRAMSTFSRIAWDVGRKNRKLNEMEAKERQIEIEMREQQTPTVQ